MLFSSSWTPYLADQSQYSKSSIVRFHLGLLATVILPNSIRILGKFSPNWLSELTGRVFDHWVKTGFFIHIYFIGLREPMSKTKLYVSRAETPEFSMMNDNQEDLRVSVALLAVKVAILFTL